MTDFEGLQKWEKGPADWEDVPTVRSALEAWSKGARVDFEVSEDLFYKLLECPGIDDDFFAFSDGRVRFKGWTASDHESRQQLAAERAAGDLDFPLTLSRAARWYCFANVYTACSMPEYVPEVLAAKDFAAARSILQDALRKAKADLDERVSTLLSTPEKPAMARHQATRGRDEARKRERAVQGCLDALNAATELAEQDELLTLLRDRGMAEVQIDYLDFLELTTFDRSEEYPHAAADGLYTYRKNAVGEVIGVASGPMAQQLGSGEPRKIAADHQRRAELNFPTALPALVEWVFAQGGGVQFAMPRADELPDSCDAWVCAISTYLGDRAQSQQIPQARVSPSGGESLKGKRREDAMTRELSALDQSITEPSGVMRALQELAGTLGSCVVEKTKGGVKWKADDGAEKELDLEALRKRLTRRNGAAVKTLGR